VIWPPSKLVGDHLKYEVEGTLKSRNLKKKGKDYLIKLQGYYGKEAIWITPKDMENVEEIMENFELNRGSNKRSCRH
jgi:hypothetical protein